MAVSGKYYGIDIVIGNSRQSGIASLILDILVLKRRLQTPEDQSEYFRMGSQGHARRLTQLMSQYNTVKDDFNSMTVDDIIELRGEICEKNHRVLVKSMPVIARLIIERTRERNMERLEEYVHVKSFRDELPMVEVLGDDPELVMWAGSITIQLN